jgi:hypothetical protein
LQACFINQRVLPTPALSHSLVSSSHTHWSQALTLTGLKLSHSLVSSSHTHWCYISLLPLPSMRIRLVCNLLGSPIPPAPSLNSVVPTKASLPAPTQPYDPAACVQYPYHTLLWKVHSYTGGEAKPLEDRDHRYRVGTHSQHETITHCRAQDLRFSQAGRRRMHPRGQASAGWIDCGDAAMRNR